MKIVVFAISIFILAGCGSLVGRTHQTGHFVVRVTDNAGGPITNAEVIVETLNRTGFNAGLCRSHYSRTLRSSRSGIRTVALCREENW